LKKSKPGKWGKGKKANKKVSDGKRKAVGKSEINGSNCTGGTIYEKGAAQRQER